jgi:cytoplasmic iron level regulating protein YaaA (DUF328/UPF0246 family)
VLILVPPSESKRPPPDHGPALDLDGLSFPELTPIRTRILDALIETSAATDAFQRLFVQPSMASWIARNTRLRELATRTAAETYIGPLHAGADLGALSPAGTERAAGSVVIFSALFGALRPSDRIPAYRLRSWSDLIGIGRVERLWRTVLPDLLAGLAGSDGVVVDLRPGSFQALGSPTGLSHRTVAVRVDPYADGRRIGDVVAKRLRGEAAHLLLEADVQPADPDAVADVLGEAWPVSLEPPTGPGRSWTLSLSARD